MKSAPVLGTPGLWFVTLGGSAAYALHLITAFWLVPIACAAGTVLWLHVLGTVTLLTAVTATVQAALVLRVAHRQQRDFARGRVGLLSAQVLAGDPGRVRFMAAVGLSLNVVAMLLIVTHWVPVAFFGPCS